MKIQKDVKAMTEALSSYFEDGNDKDIAEEVAYHLAEIKEIADRYLEVFRRLSQMRNGERNQAEAARLLGEAQALIFEQGIVHARDLRKPLLELMNMIDEDSDGPGCGA